MDNNRIGLIGPANAGKDTVADFLTTFIPGLRKRSMADALYKEVSEAFEIGEDFLRDRRWKERPTSRLSPRFCIDNDFVDCCRSLGLSVCTALSPRMALEYWGTEYRRSADPGYWVRKVDKERGPLVIPDIRFPNEKDICTTILKIRRPKEEVLRDHESDRLWRETEGVIEIWNIGSVKDLHAAVLGVVDGNTYTAQTI